MYCCMFVYLFLPLYIISRISIVLFPFFVLLVALIEGNDIGMIISVAGIIGLMIILGITLCTKIRSMYVILIFNIAFGVLDIQFAGGYDGSAHYALKYILNYYGFGRLLQTIKPMLVENFGNDIASIIIHYWLSFDDDAIKIEHVNQISLEELVTM